MVTILFEAHATSLDNEHNLSSGHNDVELSPLGKQQAHELGTRHQTEELAAVFCSDLQRSYHTAEIAFGAKFPLITDPRLRECDYGELTQHPKAEVDAVKSKYITTPFPGGESYEQTSQRMKTFLQELAETYEGKTVMIIGHRATQYGLEHWIKHVSLEACVSRRWTWQPGWIYHLEKSALS